MYNFQRVLCQVGYDQQTNRTNGNVSYFSSFVAENKLVGKGRMEILAEVERILLGTMPRGVGDARKGRVVGEVFQSARGVTLGKEESSWN